MTNRWCWGLLFVSVLAYGVAIGISVAVLAYRAVGCP